MNPLWKQWRLASLPMLPEKWPLVVYERSKEQFEVVQKISAVSHALLASFARPTQGAREN